MNALCIPRVENAVSKDYILKTFNKLKIGIIEQISETPLHNDIKHKRVFIKVRWSEESENAKNIITRLSNKETVKIVHEFPWFWRVVAKNH
jgi:hypothetical protein